jgi:hypothetical protein
LKSGGKKKGKAAFGTAIPCIQTIGGAMNTFVATKPLLTATYHYSYVPPLITGPHETVGVIFNDLVLTYNSKQVLRDNLNNYLLPRSPFVASFTVNATGASFNVMGIHAPPPKGAAATRFRPPIWFCMRLPSITTLMVGPPQNYVIGGDFNSDQASTWTSGGVAMHPFFNTPPNPSLTGYATNLPVGTLTSARKRLDTTRVGPAQYLADAYDNILYQMAPAPVVEYAMDLIGINPPPAGVGQRALLHNYWRVSDHIPVAIF